MVRKSDSVQRDRQAVRQTGAETAVQFSRLQQVCGQMARLVRVPLCVSI